MHSFLVSSRRAIPTVLWAFCPPVLQLVFCLCGQDAHTTVGGFLCSLGILPAGVAISFLFVRAGMPTLRWVVFYVVWAFCPPVLQLVFCLCGQGCPHYGGWFFM